MLSFLLSKQENEKVFFVYLITVMVVAISVLMVGLNVTFFDFGRHEHLINSKLFGVSFIRNAGLLYNYGDIAIMFSFVTPFIIYNIASGNGFERLTAGTALVVIALAAFVSLSRNVWLSCFVSFFTFIVFSLYAKKKIGLYVFIFSLLLFPVLVVFTDVFIFTTIDSLLHLRFEAVSSRTDQYEYALKQISENFFVGVGAKASQVSAGYAIHNMFLNAMMRAGVGGLFFIIIIFYTGYILSKKAANSTFDRMIVASYFGFVSAGMFYPAISSSSPVVWITLGIFLVLSFESKSKARLNSFVYS